MASLQSVTPEGTQMDKSNLASINTNWGEWGIGWDEGREKEGGILSTTTLFIY